jgi:succinate dehydrogenase/fumarate reductase flavoprotein subunit
MTSDVQQGDVVVVGGGAAGLATAVQAAQLGAEVILVEKNPRLGGTSALSVGSISASLTDFQRRKGIRDSLAEHYEDMGKFAGDIVHRDNVALRRLYVANTGETVRWLTSLGVAFFGPMPEPPHRHARMHNVLPHSGAYIHWLRKAAVGLGVRIITGTRAERLLREDERVTGVACAGPDGRSSTIRAAYGVVLAAGDFSASAELKTEHLGAEVARVEAINPASTGDGQRLGIEAGGRLRNADLALWGPEMRFVTPPRKLLLQRLPPVRALTVFLQLALRWMPQRLLRPFIMAFATSYLAPSHELYRSGAILVNGNGERFTDETKQPWLDLPNQPDGVGYIVLDARVAALFRKWPKYVSTAPGVAYAFIDDYRRNRKDIFHEADTVEGLAARIRVPADRLAAAMTGTGTLPDGTRRCGQAPFIALGPVKSWIVMTDGGLVIDETMRVLDTEDRPIPGLYAAGSTGQGGLLLQGHGNHLGWAFVSGRLAGKAVASDRPQCPASRNRVPSTEE